MLSLGRAEEVRRILEASGISTVIFSEVEPDPPIELIERAGEIYTGIRVRRHPGPGRRQFDGYGQGPRTAGHPPR